MPRRFLSSRFRALFFRPAGIKVGKAPRGCAAASDRDFSQIVSELDERFYEAFGLRRHQFNPWSELAVYR
jgi:hypothetical protein